MKEEFHNKSIGESIKIVKSSLDGLSQKEVNLRLQKYGKNIIKKKNTFQPLKVLLAQFNSFLIYILLIASLISFLINHLVDALVILAIVLLNSAIGFFQQYRAEKAIQNLKKLILPKTRVIRDGKQMEIDSTDLVVGDIVLLEAGDKISADLRIIESENAATNEAVLTGESLPKSKESLEIEISAPLAERTNMLYTGTSFVRGTAKALVVIPFH